MRVAEVARHPVAYAWATAIVVGTALRTASLERRLSLDQLLAALREGPPLPAGLRDPVIYGRVTNRLAPLLPPRGMGLCMKRSLWLLHIWTRCGLAPRLHLGAQKEGERLAGHAWLTLDGDAAASELEPLLGTPGPEFPDFFAL